jgi:hypothetical protein
MIFIAHVVRVGCDGLPLLLLVAPLFCEVIRNIVIEEIICNMENILKVCGYYIEQL